MTPDSYEKKKIRRIAYKVRRAVERLAEHEAEMDEGTYEYNCPITLGGLCARATALLSFQLCKAGIDHKIAYCDFGHVYIRWNHYIVDITATQFGDFFGKTMIRTYEDVLSLCDRNASHSGCYWVTSQTFASIDDLINFQYKHDWPIEQTVNPEDLAYLGDKYGI